jgi:hyaluronan synthase
MAVIDTHRQGALSVPVSSPRQVTLLRKLLNIAGCILCLLVYWVATVHCRWPVTLDFVLTVALTELTRYINEGRRIAYYEEENLSQVAREKVNPEKAALDLELSVLSGPRLDCMAAVVGWREDPALFTRALESYKRTRGCVFLLVGIDGDEAEDRDMIDVFNMVRRHRGTSSPQRN